MRDFGNSRDSTGRVPRSPWSQAGSVAAAGLSAVAAVVVLAASCARLTPLTEADHDHAAARGDHAHDHAHGATEKPATDPGSFADALVTIIELDGKIHSACAGDDPEAAHDELHAIGHLLEELPGLATTAGVALDAEAVKRSAGVLFDAFSRIDDKLHGGGGSTYAEEAETIGRELGSFRAFLVEHQP